MVYGKDIKKPLFPTGGFSPFSWPTRLETMFPVLHPDRSDSIDLVRKNWQDPSSNFSWFCQALKMAKGKLKRKSLFVRWLMLCVARPWTKPDFVISWGWTAADFEKAVEIAMEALPDVFDAWVSEKLFYRIRDDSLLRLCVTGIYSWGRKEFAEYWAQRSRNFDWEKYRVWCLKGKLREFLWSAKTVTKRKVLRKLDITADQYEMVMAEFRERGLVQEKCLPRNSVEISWTR